MYPIHRLDRKTSGVLLFALSKESLSGMQQKFSERAVTKQYLAIVRGYFPEEAKVDYPVTNDRLIKQDAITHFKTLKRTEIDVPHGKFQTSRYSLIEAIPYTGRMHQIRKHCNHLRHPIIGDRPHGCNKQNKLFKEKWEMTTMLLHAHKITFEHPFLKDEVSISAPILNEFKRMLKALGFERLS